MAYNVERFTKLSGLKQLSQKFKTERDALSKRIDDIVSEGGEPNVITSIKVNGTAQTITDKAVNITVPTNVSQLSNDSGFQTSTQVQTAIQTAIAETGHASFEKVDAVPTAANAQENVLYLVKNATTNHYDIYAKVGNTVELLDDTTVDLTGYVQKETGKGLSANDYTDAEKTKLGGLNNYTHPAHTAKTSGLYKVTVDSLGHVSAASQVSKADITGLGIPAQDTTYSPATASANGLMTKEDKAKLDGITVATDEEVAEMLQEVFGDGE